MANTKKRFNLYDFFNPSKDGKGIKKEPEGKPTTGFIDFFKLYYRSLSRLLTLNLYMVFGNFPLLFALFAMEGYLNKHTRAPSSQYFGIIHGASLLSGWNPALSALFGVHGIQTDLSVNTPASLTLFGLSALVIFTWGLVSVGTTYIMRNIVRREPVFMWYDFWYAIKHNLRQGMILGIIDLLICGLLTYDVIFFYYNIGSFLNNVMFYMSLFVTLVYLLMRFYMYLFVVTFDLKLWQVIKNSFIFAFLGLKRNILALLGLVAVGLINYGVFLMYIPLGILLPFTITFSTGAFMACYAAFPKIKELMIDPYSKENEAPAEEPVFRDMG